MSYKDTTMSLQFGVSFRFCTVLILVSLGIRINCDSTIQVDWADGICKGTKLYHTTDDTFAVLTYRWEEALQTCQDEGWALVSMDSATERDALIDVLERFPGKIFWTQGALVAQYADGTLVNTDFRADEYEFVNPGTNPSWCLALTKPVDADAPILMGANCEYEHSVLCQEIPAVPCP